MPSSTTALRAIYKALASHYGSAHWWPARTSFEVMVGAILTQNTAWTNVEKAIGNLRRRRLLTVRAINNIDETRLAPLIRPSGYFNQKAKKLKALAAFIMREYRGTIARMRAADLELLRHQLLSVKGIGPETADSVLLYALGKRIFVVDAYTKRIFSRHYFFKEDLDYEAVQKYFMHRLPQDVALYNEFHALIVYAGKEFCRKNPKCTGCPLDRFPHRPFPERAPVRHSATEF